jgi:hypothetical protein
MTNYLYISEYANPPIFSGNIIAAGPEPSITTQKLTITTHQESNAFNAGTNFVRLHCDAICSVAFGAAPVADVTSARLAANQTEFFVVVPGQKLSVVTNT